MYYYWWLVSILFYLFILLVYVLGSFYIFEDKRLGGIDTVFFGVTSIITLSIIPLIKINVYGT